MEDNKSNQILNMRLSEQEKELIENVSKMLTEKYGFKFNRTMTIKYCINFAYDIMQK